MDNDFPNFYVDFTFIKMGESMPIVKKIKLGGEALEVDKITRTIRKELALRSLTYINPMIARGILADEISNKVTSLMKKIMITRKMDTSSKLLRLKELLK